MVLLSLSGNPFFWIHLGQNKSVRQAQLQPPIEWFFMLIFSNLIDVLFAY
jgi:hypothetical protein